MKSAKKKPAKKETVRVRVTARQMVTYDQIVELTCQEWEDFKRRSPKAHTEAGGDLPLNLADIDDGYDIEPNDFEAIVVGADGKPTGERYEWE
jgi:hypothetical protein